MTPVSLPYVSPMPRQVEPGKSSQPRERGGEHDRFAQELNQQEINPHELSQQESGRQTEPRRTQAKIQTQKDADVSQPLGQTGGTPPSLHLPASMEFAIRQDDTFSAYDGPGAKTDQPSQPPQQALAAGEREGPSQSAAVKDRPPVPDEYEASPAVSSPDMVQSLTPAVVSQASMSKTDNSDHKFLVVRPEADLSLAPMSVMQPAQTPVASAAPETRTDVAPPSAEARPEARDLLAFASKTDARPVAVADREKKQNDMPQHTTGNHKTANRQPEPHVQPPPLTAAQSVLNLVSLPLSQPLAGTASLAVQGTAEAATRAPRPVANRGGVPMISSSREASAVLAPAQSQSENGVAVPDLISAFARTMPENFTHSDRPDQGAASGTALATALSPHTGRAGSDGGAVAESEAPAPVLSAKVLEVTTHFPAVPPSANLGESGQHAARPETTQAPAAAVATAPAAPDAHQTALHTLNLALGGEDSTPVSVRMRLQGDQLNVAISSHHADAVAAMTRDHGELSQSLIGAGYKLDSLTVQLVGAPAGSGDSSGGGAAAGQGHMARQQQGRSDQASSQQNENTRDSNGGNRGQLQQGLSDRERAAARARAALYI